jgi:AraC-like DNA-binding protein
MPPKMLARKYRALRAARALHSSGEDERAVIVSAFYDQSHMIREIKHFAGQTPGQIRLSRAETDHLIDQRRAMAGKISRLVSEI